MADSQGNNNSHMYQPTPNTFATFNEDYSDDMTQQSSEPYGVPSQNSFDDTLQPSHHNNLVSNMSFPRPQNPYGALSNDQLQQLQQQSAAGGQSSALAQQTGNVRQGQQGHSRQDQQMHSSQHQQRDFGQQNLIHQRQQSDFGQQQNILQKLQHSGLTQQQIQMITTQLQQGDLSQQQNLRNPLTQGGSGPRPQTNIGQQNLLRQYQVQQGNLGQQQNLPNPLGLGSRPQTNIGQQSLLGQRQQGVGIGRQQSLPNPLPQAGFGSRLQTNPGQQNLGQRQQGGFARVNSDSPGGHTGPTQNVVTQAQGQRGVDLDNETVSALKERVKSATEERDRERMAVLALCDKGIFQAQGDQPKMIIASDITAISKQHGTSWATKLRETADLLDGIRHSVTDETYTADVTAGFEEGLQGIHREWKALPAGSQARDAVYNVLVKYQDAGNRAKGTQIAIDEAVAAYAPQQTDPLGSSSPAQVPQQSQDPQDLLARNHLNSQVFGESGEEGQYGNGEASSGYLA